MLITDKISLADLRPALWVVPHHWLVGIAPPKIMGRALSLKSWA
jgi:hypothetical protein